GESRAGAPAARWVPPVEDVALDELVRRVQEDLRPRELRPQVDEGGGILELVAEAEGAARLVEGRAAPELAAESLIAEPAVHHEIDGRRGRLHLDRRKRLPPDRPYLVERLVQRTCTPVPCDELACCARVRRLAEKKRALDRAAGRQRQRDLQRGARIEAGSRPAVEPRGVRERRGVGRRPVPTDEGGAVT